VDDCKAASEGTTNRVRLKEDRFYSIAMPLPQIEEQRRIVERLEALGQKVGSVRQIAAELSQTTGQLATVLARRMFDGLTPTRQLGSVVSVVGGGTPSKGNPEFWNGSIPWVSPKDMKVRIIQDSADHISESAIRGSAAKLVQPGAVLIVVRGMILAHTVPSAVLAIPATINQDMKALIPNEGLDSAFLSAQLWAFNRELLALVEKSTHDTRKLETDKLLQFPVIVPPLDVQRAVCGDLRQLEEKTKLIAEHRKAEQMGIGALMPSILNQAFCGGL
jgi:type I restriction enzyme S subunit